MEDPLGNRAEIRRPAADGCARNPGKSWTWCLRIHRTSRCRGVLGFWSYLLDYSLSGFWQSICNFLLVLNPFHNPNTPVHPTGFLCSCEQTRFKQALLNLNPLNPINSTRFRAIPACFFYHFCLRKSKLPLFHGSWRNIFLIQSSYLQIPVWKNNPLSTGVSYSRTWNLFLR